MKEQDKVNVMTLLLLLSNKKNKLFQSSVTFIKKKKKKERRRKFQLKIKTMLLILVSACMNDIYGVYKRMENEKIRDRLIHH
jgi:hypothetical protein